MAWMWWLLAPIASTVLGTIVIWWRSPAQTNRRLRRTDAISEHQALLRALAQQRPAAANPSTTGQAAPSAPAAYQVVAADPAAEASPPRADDGAVPGTPAGTAQQPLSGQARSS